MKKICVIMMISLLLITSVFVISGGADTQQDITITVTYFGPDWDIDHDGLVDTYDVSELVAHYGDIGDPGWSRIDIDPNGIIDTFDVSLLVAHYGDNWLS